MSYKWYGQKTFNVGDYVFECKSQRTNYGFRHWVDLRRDGRLVSSGKGCYYNRTWERYTYQSAIKNAIDRAETLTKAEKKDLRAWAAEGKEPIKQEMEEIFGPALMAAAIGDILCNTQAEKNTWRKRMLGTIPGLNFPDDFDGLTEEEKQRRLDAVDAAINTIKED